MAARSAADITYINADGTSTVLGDQAETAAVKSVFKEYARDISISSTKSQLGICWGRAVASNWCFSVLALTHNVIPPTINCRHARPAVRPGLHAQSGTAAEGHRRP